MLAHVRTKAIPNAQLKRLREAQGLSQARLAELAGCGQTDVAKLETGARRTTAEWASRLAPPLAVEPQALFPTTVTDDGNPAPGPYRLDPTKLRISIAVARRMAAAHGGGDNEAAVSELAAAIYDILVESKRAGRSVVDDRDAIALIERVLKRFWRPAAT